MVAELEPLFDLRGSVPLVCGAQHMFISKLTDKFLISKLIILNVDSFSLSQSFEISIFHLILAVPFHPTPKYRFGVRDCWSGISQNRGCSF